MANNRLWLVDSATGDRFLLLKSFGSGWYARCDDDTLMELCEWLLDHDTAASFGNCEARTTLQIVAENDEPTKDEYQKEDTK